MKSELRVHGVSGTQPRDMLYTDPVLRDTASPDQPRSYTEVLEIAPAEEEFATQAFHWGGLTAGSRLTAFWILLAPFAFANVAGWMSKDRTNRFGHAMIRLAGLGLTALFITQVFTATVLLPYLWLLGGNEFEILGRTFEVGDGLQRWAFLLLVVVLTGAFLILLLKASTQSHFEPRNTVEQSQVLAWPSVAYMDPKTNDPDLIPLDYPPDEWEDPVEAQITDPRMWRPSTILHRLRRLHLAVGYGIIALEVAIWTQTAWAATTAGVLLVVVALVVLLTTFIPTNKAVLRATAILPLIAVLVWFAALATIFTGSVAGQDITTPHIITFITALVMGAFVALSLSAGLISVGAFVLGTFFGGVLGLAVGIVIESILGLNPPDGPGILEENGAAWVAIAMLGLLVWLAIFAIWLSWRETEHTASQGILGLLRRVVLQAPKLFEAAAVYGLLAGGVAAFLGWQNEVWEPGALKSPSPDSRVYDIAIFAGVFLVAFLALRVWRHFGLKFVPLVVLAAALIAFAAYRDFFVVEFFKVQIALKGNLVDIAVAIAIIVPGAFMLRSIWTGAGSSEEGQKKRRNVGILWDMGSFWPRWYHPLAPPAYGPKAVTQLRRELESHQRDVLGAHSQGSLISAVALIYTDGTRKPHRFITYGSQLGVLYPGMFPGAGIEDENGLVEKVHTAYGSEWINLYRDTDPIGGHFVRRLGTQNHQVGMWTGHSRYEPTDEYKDARRGDSGEAASTIS
ncbi:MAG TPA: hypothetical protein VJ950_00555 [Acidimicrobiia bacterium]|nr:hypothetical protein [Acidimicrobiia bacterium]